jgi:hypothetical protein
MSYSREQSGLRALRTWRARCLRAAVTVVALLSLVGIGSLAHGSSRLSQLRQGLWVVNNDPDDDPLDRSFSFVLSRDRKQLTDVRMKVHTNCSGEGERDWTLRIASARLTDQEVPYRSVKVDGLLFSGRFVYDPPKGPWLFEGYAEPDEDDVDAEGNPRCSGGANAIAISAYDRAVKACVMLGWNRALRSRHKERAKRRLYRRCARAANRRLTRP